MERRFPGALPPSVSSLGGANLYGRFLRDFAHSAAALTDLLRGNAAFRWDAEQQRAFDALKIGLSTAPVLHPPDMAKPFTLYTDTSATAIGFALMQDHGNGLVPVAYWSRTLPVTERNWATHERELLAVVKACKEFRHYLLGAGGPTTVRTDHRALRFIQNQKELSGKQARWVEFLAEYDLSIEYVEGTANVVANMLSRLSSDPDEPSDPSDTPPGMQLHVISSVTTDLDSAALDQLRAACAADPLAQAADAALEGGEPSDLVLDDGLYYRQRPGGLRQLYVPLPDLQRRVLSELHDAPVAGHLGRDKTLDAVTRRFWWPKVHRDVDEYVRSCPTCQPCKHRYGKVAGKLMPLPTLLFPWEQITMDIVGLLNETEDGHNAFVVFVDRLTKMIHVAPCRIDQDARDFARMFFREIFRLHGLPTALVPDRDTRWTSRFWETLFSMMGLRVRRCRPLSLPREPPLALSDLFW